MNKKRKFFKKINLVFIIFISSLLTLNCTNHLKILLYDQKPINNTTNTMFANGAIYFFYDLLDSSGNDHHLVNHGADPAENRDGVPNSAFDFTNQCLQTTTPNELNFTTEITISAWINSVNTSANQKVVANATLVLPNAGYVLAITNDHVYVQFWDSEGDNISYFNGSELLSDNTWHHIAVTWKTGGFITSYVDGILDQKVPASSNPIGQVTDNYFTIGAASWNTSTYKFQGIIDDVRVFDVELSEAEIQGLAALPAD